MILPRDPVSAADTLARAVATEEVLSGMGHAARTLARERFDRDVLAAELLEVIERTYAS